MKIHHILWGFLCMQGAVASWSMVIKVGSQVNRLAVASYLLSSHKSKIVIKLSSKNENKCISQNFWNFFCSNTSLNWLSWYHIIMRSKYVWKVVEYPKDHHKNCAHIKEKTIAKQYISVCFTFFCDFIMTTYFCSWGNVIKKKEGQRQAVTGIWVANIFELVLKLVILISANLVSAQVLLRKWQELQSRLQLCHSQPVSSIFHLNSWSPIFLAWDNLLRRKRFSLCREFVNLTGVYTVRMYYWHSKQPVKALYSNNGYNV